MRRLVVTIALLSLLTALVPGAAGAAEAPLPTSMAAVGDSITQAASTGGGLGTDYPANSWSTGTSSSVNSHYLRLLAAGAPISGRNANLAVSGAKVAGLEAQMQAAVALRPDYLTVLIGGNDLCTDTVASMTTTAAFEASFATAMDTITAGSPTTRVYVVSIPDVHQLWSLFRNNWWARIVWSAGAICQSLLANPTSTQQADVDRRAEVRARNQAFNAILASVCERHAQCHHDAGRVFAYRFASSDVSGDYFHPSTSGQANLARETWLAGYAWASPGNAAPTASFASSCVDLGCAFDDTSTDSDGTIVSRSWAFGDGASSTAENPSHTYAAAGTYAVSLTVTDSGGATSTTSQSISVTAPAVSPMWVTAMSGAPRATRTGWTATITVSVGGDTGPVAGVTVSGTWTGASGPSGCTTNAVGTCSFESSAIGKKVTSVRYSVTGLAKAGWRYEPSRNQVSSVVVTKP